MGKSIESIWKKGFDDKDALHAPRINDLYNRKSIHLIDRFKRMFKINFIAVTLGAVFLLLVSYLVGILYMGLGFMLIAMSILFINYKQSKHLEKIDNSLDSYRYLKSFDTWLREMVGLNIKMARIYYPLFFLSIFVGFWFKEENGQLLGQLFTEQLLTEFPDLTLLFGMPLVLLVALVCVLTLLFVVGGKIYIWDLGIIYKKLLVKLDLMLTDMEDLI